MNRTPQLRRATPSGPRWASNAARAARSSPRGARQVAGSALVIGAAIGYLGKVSARWIAAVMAFGAGVLISALSFDLMDEAYLRHRGAARKPRVGPLHRERHRGHDGGRRGRDPR